MSIRDLLYFNLLLQFFDGFISYQAFSIGAVEASPFVAAAIMSWGMVYGLFYKKMLASVLLLLIFALRHRRRLLVIQALTVTASAYTCVAIACLWGLLR
jgi:hypothetical protein